MLVPMLNQRVRRYPEFFLILEYWGARGLLGSRMGISSFDQLRYRESCPLEGLRNFREFNLYSPVSCLSRALCWKQPRPGWSCAITP